MSTINKWIIIAIMFVLSAMPCLAQTPTLIWHAMCPNSRSLGSGNGGGNSATPDYTCYFAEPVSGSGQTLVVWFGYDNTSNNQSFTFSDSTGDTVTSQVSSGNSPNGNAAQILTVPVSNGAVWFRVHLNSGGTAGFWQMSMGLYFNITTSSPKDQAHCNTGTSATVTAGLTGTLSASGDLLYQGSYPDTTASQTSFTVGSQSNITWKMEDEAYEDGAAFQDGVYSVTTSFNPTFTQGTSAAFISCAIALKAGSSGSGPTGTRILHRHDEEVPNAAASPVSMNLTSTGNLVVVGYTAGTTTISSISSTPSCTWSHTAVTPGGDISSQFWYCLNPSFNGPVKITATLSAAATGDTYLIYDVTGSGTWSFDKDSGFLSGVAGSITNPLPTCSSCLTPAQTNEIIFSNLTQANCTVTGTISTPSGADNDCATFNGNQINGPQAVCQNNGDLHYYNGGSTSAISVSWPESCTSAEGGWGSTVAAFKLTSSSTTVCTMTTLGAGPC